MCTRSTYIFSWRGINHRQINFRSIKWKEVRVSVDTVHLTWSPHHFDSVCSGVCSPPSLSCTKPHPSISICYVLRGDGVINFISTAKTSQHRSLQTFGRVPSHWLVFILTNMTLTHQPVNKLDQFWSIVKQLESSGQSWFLLIWWRIAQGFLLVLPLHRVTVLNFQKKSLKTLLTIWLKKYPVSCTIKNTSFGFEAIYSLYICISFLDRKQINLCFHPDG